MPAVEKIFMNPTDLDTRIADQRCMTNYCRIPDVNTSSGRAKSEQAVAKLRLRTIKVGKRRWQQSLSLLMTDSCNIYTANRKQISRLLIGK